jgi:hypothetical protein
MPTGKNRKAAEEYIIKYIDALLPGSPNTKIYERLFANMDDKAFDTFMHGLNDGTIRLAIIVPNLTGMKLSVERNLALAKELGHEFFEQLLIDPGNDIPPYMTPEKYLIVDLPVRRQAQLQEKKISIPEHNRSVDDFTGQPTGASKGSKISMPEIQILAARNLDRSLLEMIKMRGGDTKAFNAMNDSISKTGGVNLKSIETLGTTVTSTDTLRAFLTACHLQNTL